MSFLLYWHKKKLTIFIYLWFVQYHQSFHTLYLTSRGFACFQYQRRDINQFPEQILRASFKTSYGAMYFELFPHEKLKEGYVLTHDNKEKWLEIPRTFWRGTNMPSSGKATHWCITSVLVNWSFLHTHYNRWASVTNSESGSIFVL